MTKPTNSLPGFVPDWPAPSRVRSLQTTRSGGVSPAPYASLNLGDHVGDAPAHVAANRARLRAGLPGEPLWLQQVHGTRVADADSATTGREADGVVARRPGSVCAIMTADCLPVLLCDQDGTVVGAAHAGWRGLAAGVLENTVAAMGVAPERLLAWLGPAIGPQAFEVGPEVRDAFEKADPRASQAFVPGASAGKYLADIYALARLRLQAAGVREIHGGGLCTVGDAASYFSYRRDRVCGRMASLIWLEP
ncbi:MAG: peptidoglycan editing factor PgeF [Betaproteobacteria bacterium]|nr:MAG: peptidoglycan editing factor PgeF [Betaproteobacteria bacterium]